MTSQPEPPKDANDQQAGVARPLPTRRASVVVPTVVFFVFDTALLTVLGRTFISALIISAITSICVYWWLQRRYARAALAHQQHLDSSTPVRPPVGSWSNPSRTQRWSQRWDRSQPYRRRRHRR
jgi:hypothetical protein